PVRELTKELTGSLYGDKGYLSQELADDLAKTGITFITQKRRNMKAHMQAEWDKIMLSRRFIIESVPQAYKLAA
ncbi:transposase, partial [Xenorhabdus sp. XENO-10]